MKKLIILLVFLLCAGTSYSQQKWDYEIEFPCLTYESPISDACLEQSGLLDSANAFRYCFNKYYIKDSITDNVDFVFTPYNPNLSDNLIFVSSKDNSGHNYRLNATLACLKKDTNDINYLFELNRELCKIKHHLIEKIVITDEDADVFFICMCNGMGTELFAKYISTILDKKN